MVHFGIEINRTAGDEHPITVTRGQAWKAKRPACQRRSDVMVHLHCPPRIAAGYKSHLEMSNRWVGPGVAKIAERKLYNLSWQICELSLTDPGKMRKFKPEKNWPEDGKVRWRKFSVRVFLCTRTMFCIDFITCNCFVAVERRSCSSTDLHDALSHASWKYDRPRVDSALVVFLWHHQCDLIWLWVWSVTSCVWHGMV